MKTEELTLTELTDAIEAELKRLDLFNHQPPTAQAPRGPFGAGSMSFERWLSWVFLSTLRRASASHDLPSPSHVATAAVRNLDGVPGTGPLLELLREVDSRANGSAGRR